ncbi:putative RNA-directed DNA polymerase, partial [Tanacetum coccineum]
MVLFIKLHVLILLSKMGLLRGSIDIYLMLPFAVLSRKSPFELVYKSEPSYSHFRTFGCLCFSTVLNNNDKFVERSKVNAESNSLAFAGGSADLNAEPMFEPALADDSASHPASTSGKSVQKSNILDSLNNRDTLDSIIDDDISDQLDATSDDEKYDSEGEEFGKFDLLFGLDEGDPERVVLDKTVRRSSIKTSLPSRLKDYEIQGKVKYGLNRYVNYAKLNAENYSFKTNLNKTIEPKTYKEASTDSKWVEAMNLEMEALYRNGTRELTILPKGRKAISSKWVFKIKYKSIGEVDRYKERLVAKDFNQKEGLDYEETFLPVDVYMSQPEGYFAPGDQRVCKLKKSLYGLMKQSDKDVIVVTLVYVDDIIITGNSIVEIENFKQLFSNVFMIKDLGKLKYFLGIEIGPSALLPGAEAEYRAMSNVAYEIIWILKILTDLKVNYTIHVEMFCDSSAAMQIAANPVFHERTKHFEIDLYFLRKKMAEVFEMVKEAVHNETQGGKQVLEPNLTISSLDISERLERNYT